MADVLLVVLGWCTLAAICVFCFVAGCLRGEAIANRHRCPEPLVHEIDREFAKHHGGAA